jgi:hypothetical protein
MERAVAMVYLATLLKIRRFELMKASWPRTRLLREQKAGNLKDSGQGRKICCVAVQSALGSHVLH